MLIYHSDKLVRFKVTVTLTFNPLTSKSIGVIYWSGPASMSSLRAMGAGNVELSLGQAFRIQGHCDLDLMTSKYVEFVYWSSPTSKLSLRTIGPGIVELSLGQALVYRRTDMCKAIYPSSLKGA